MCRQVVATSSTQSIVWGAPRSGAAARERRPSAGRSGIVGKGCPSKRSLISINRSSWRRSSVPPVSWRTHPRWPYFSFHVLTASLSTCSWTPRWRSPVQTSTSDRPSSACHSSAAGRRARRPCRRVDRAVGQRLDRAVGKGATATSHTSPVAAAATASSSVGEKSVIALTCAAACIPWKPAGAAGVAATGVAVARKRRAHEDR
jgi:hypothetical protein